LILEEESRRPYTLFFNKNGVFAHVDSNAVSKLSLAPMSIFTVR